jgi:hypothetical protein
MMKKLVPFQAVLHLMTLLQFQRSLSIHQHTSILIAITANKVVVNVIHTGPAKNAMNHGS